MAQYTVTHSCGHQATHQLYGPRHQREGRMAWLGRQDCPDCAAQERAEAGQEAALEAYTIGLPALDGSPKQVNWAERIRLHTVNLTALRGSPVWDYFSEHVLRPALAEIDQAAWWIDHRNQLTTPSDIVDLMAVRMGWAEFSGRPTEAGWSILSALYQVTGQPFPDRCAGCKFKKEIIDLLGEALFGDDRTSAP